jgi:magnesium-transporting ATPase (P-type)
VCNKAIYLLKGGEAITGGDPTEIALLEVASLAGIKEDFEIVDEIPFDPTLRYMATAIKKEEYVEIYVKGSVEKILSMCRGALVDGSVVELDERQIRKIASDFALQGLRVLAFAYKVVSLEEFDCIEKHLNDLIFLGLQCMIDPPRKECYEAIKRCKEAGVRVIMITGDHPSTASFIAKELNIGGNVVTGDEIESMSDDELKEVLRKTNVFARILPKMKLRIVKLLQEMGETVAVTGDGVNDAPALKRADIGVAMGSGTEVAKESAEIILLDDNFATIVDAIVEGRNIFRKIQKILAWLLPTNVGEGIVVLAAFLLGISLPILPVQTLWINTITAILLGTTLVFEPKEPNLLKLKPITGELLNPTILFRIVWVAVVLVACAYFLYFRYGENELIARTVAMNAIVFFEIFYLLNSRSIDLSFIKTLKFKNRAIYLGIFATIVLQLIATYSPHLNEVLHTTPLNASMWLEIVTVSSLIFLLVELEKYIRANFYKINFKL